jgi:hypothetical protein
METYPVLVGCSLAVGVGLMANALIHALYALGFRLSRGLSYQPNRLSALGLTSARQPAESTSEDELLGLARIPWTNLYALSALTSLGLFDLIGPALGGSRLALLGLPGGVWLVRRYLVHQRRRFMVGQVRQLLVDIRLHMSLNGSLLLGLENIARTSGVNAPVYRALKRRMSGGSAKSGLEVLEQVAKDINSVHLLRVAQRVRSAQQSGGVLGVDQAIASSVEELNDEIAGQAEEQMQQMPTRITLLAMPFLLGPIVILLFYPLVDRILATLAGTAIGGGF